MGVGRWMVPGDRAENQLLRDRPDVEHRLRRECDSELETRHPVAARVEDFSVLVDAECAAGRVGAVEALEDAVGAECASVARADDVLSANGARRCDETGDEDGAVRCRGASVLPRLPLAPLTSRSRRK
jgi:hypothetical protein